MGKLERALLAEIAGELAEIKKLLTPHSYSYSPYYTLNTTTQANPPTWIGGGGGWGGEAGGTAGVAAYRTEPPSSSGPGVALEWSEEVEHDLTADPGRDRLERMLKDPEYAEQFRAMPSITETLAQMLEDHDQALLKRLHQEPR